MNPRAHYKGTLEHTTKALYSTLRNHRVCYIKGLCTLKILFCRHAPIFTYFNGTNEKKNYLFAFNSF